jgi:HEPN domain-containing protein
VTNVSLAQSYLLKARSRLKILSVLLDEGAYSDVVREAQEIVELALKGMLRQVGVEPPKWHDVGGFLLEFADRFPAFERGRLERLAEISTRLRKEREFSLWRYRLHPHRAVLAGGCPASDRRGASYRRRGGTGHPWLERRHLSNMWKEYDFTGAEREGQGYPASLSRLRRRPAPSS